MKRELEEGDDEGAPAAKRHGGKGSKGQGKSGKGGGGKGGGKSGGKGGYNGGNGKGTKGGMRDLRRHVFKVLCSDPFAANIIGHQGAHMSALEEETGCSMWISKREEFYPRSRCRLLIISGDKEEQVMSALKALVPRLAEVGEKDRELGLNADSDTPLLGKEDGEYVFRVALPSLIRGKLIGTRGANIEKLRDETGAKIFVENDVHLGHQSTRIIGQPSVITATLQRVNTLVQEEADTEEFADWASVQWFEGGGDDQDYGQSWGGGDKDKGRSRGGNAKGSSNQPLAASTPVEALDEVQGQFPDGGLDMDHVITCDLPGSVIGAILGQRGEYVQHVESSTGTRVQIAQEPADFQTVSVVGPLLWVYVAHAMILRKYHEKEAENQRRAEAQEQQGQTAAIVEDLQSKLEELQSQLAQVTASARGAKPGGSGRPAKGKGKR